MNIFRRIAALVAVAVITTLAGCSGGGAASAAAPVAVPGTIALASSTSTVTQSAGTMSVTVTRSGGTSGNVSVNYTTVDGTALAGTDYTKTSGSLVWNDGDATSRTITIPIATSPSFAGTRAFTVTLSGAANGASLGTATSTITITGSGAPGTLSLTSSTASTTQASGSLTVSIGRSGGSSGVVTVNYLTQDGTATAGSEFARTAGLLQWNDGDTTLRNVTIPITNSGPFGGTRAFAMTLYAPTGGATLGTSIETITITGNGDPGVTGFQVQVVNVSQTSGTAALVFTRTGGSYGAASIGYETRDGTAVAGSDYTKIINSVSWAAGDTADKVANIPVSPAPLFAGTKTFTVIVSGGTGATLDIARLNLTVNITGGLLTPANYFSFTFPTGTWKLQLPIDQFGGTGGTNNIQYPSIEETTAQLTAGFVDPYFYADTQTYAGATNHLIFVAPSNGAVTTPGGGSDHTRSELRELYTGTGADSNHDWTSAIGGTLTANCVVQSVAASSDEATIGQIHNQTYVFLLLIYRPAQKDVAVSIYSSLGSSTQARTPIVTGVNIGDPISYSMTYSGNTFNVTVNGTAKTFAIDPSWAGTPMYFKLGAYHAAPNIGNPAGDQTQVAFSSFAVTH